MYPICYQRVSGRYFQPEPAMYSRCFHWFPGPLAPSVTAFGIPSPTGSSFPRTSSSTRKNSLRYHLLSPSHPSLPHLGTPSPSSGQRELPRSKSTSLTYLRSSLSSMRRCDTNGPKSATSHPQQAYLVEVLCPRSPRRFSAPLGHLDPLLRIRGSLRKRSPTILNTNPLTTQAAPRVHPLTRNNLHLLLPLTPFLLLPHLPFLSLKGLFHQTLSQSTTKKRT